MNHELSFMALIAHADPIVQAVMAILLLSSVACWAITVEKLVRFGSLRRSARNFEAAVKADALLGGANAGEGVEAAILAAAARERKDGIDAGESRYEFRVRLEMVMRQAMAQQLRQVEPGLPFLATVGSAAPFIGLFGTVWGVMNSFTAIASSNDTSLAVVAPGIAEALFATALGLVAAIPAVVLYNKFSTDLGRLAQRFNVAIGEAARQYSRMTTTHSTRSMAEAGQ